MWSWQLVRQQLDEHIFLTAAITLAYSNVALSCSGSQVYRHGLTSDGALPAEIASHVVMHLRRAGIILLLLALVVLLRLGCAPPLLLLLLCLVRTIVGLCSIITCVSTS